MVELFKHKEKLLRLSTLSEDELLEVFYKLLKRINIYDEDEISPLNWKAAIDLCSNIDEKDSVFIALTLQLQGVLWTGDKKLVNGLRAKGFNLFFE
jgi:predicted nucleic acid-binding protein